ncbi:hypothetical protein Mapa_016790 [Marchantia paleacea]|nr:hypothetical protein Mapa_016790 [Marchantia paleacea]
MNLCLLSSWWVLKTRGLDFLHEDLLFYVETWIHAGSDRVGMQCAFIKARRCIGNVEICLAQGGLPKSLVTQRVGLVILIMSEMHKPQRRHMSQFRGYLSRKGTEEGPI